MTTITGAGRRVFGSSILLLALASAGMATTADAQYFGRNKVQYEGFDFRIYRSEHFDVHFYQEFASPATDATRMLERWYGRLSGVLEHQFARNPIVLYANHPDFQQTNVIGGEISEGTGGVTESNRTRVVLPLTGVYADNDHVLGHELVHVFQYDIAGSESGGGLPNMSRLPLWTIEGLAEYLSIGRQDAHTAMWLRDAIIKKDIPTIRDLAVNPKYFPYRYGQAVWAYIGGRWGDARAATLYRTAAATGDLEGAIREVLGVSSDSLSKQWRAAIIEHYEPLMTGRTPPDSAGKPLIVEKDKGGLNISPVISPDGRYVAFFSQRGLFSVDLFVADAQTGRILKTLASPTKGGHFDDLSFINSAGAWSPDSKKFAFIVFADGDNEIHVLDVASRDVEARIKTPGVGAVTGVTWSPDGTRIAFAGVGGGVSDLFVVNANGSNLVRLTNDKWAAVHPAWSPDGRNIAFATDQGPGANLDILTTSAMRIALLDIATNRVTVLPGIGDAKSINPQFSPDGRSIYFISDAEGFSDIFKMDLNGAALVRVTHLKTGVSGITYLSPALSVSQGTGRLVFSVFSGSGTGIYSLEANAAGGAAFTVSSAAAAGGTLPPLRTGTVEGYLADNTTYLPAATTFPERDYSARLGLDYIGEPTIGFMSSDYGSGFVGSVSAFFGDMLGNKSLGIAVSGQGNVRDYGAQAFFSNTAHRLNWALIGGRTPYLSGFTSIARTSIGGQPANQIDQTIRRTYFDNASILFQYPFSTTRRVEFDAGFTHLSYNTETLRWVETAGGVDGPQRIAQPSPESITYGTASAALVGDNSFMGYASPIAGGRYRLEGSPIFGELNFTNLLADGRKYFFARPVTFAFRGMHYGRYGGDAEDERLTPLYIGNDQFVRGYSIYSFTSADCSGAATATTCPEFDRLIGTRIAVANAEIRVPLFGQRGFGLIPTSFIPIELAAFADAGMAWSRGESVDIRFDRATSDRVPVFSAGMSSRLNLFGFAVVEIFYARPFQRTAKSGVWGVQLVPGW